MLVASSVFAGDYRMPLVLSLRPSWTGTGEYIRVDGPCVIRLSEIRGNAVRLAIEAEKSVHVLRGSLEQNGGKGDGR